MSGKTMSERGRAIRPLLYGGCAVVLAVVFAVATSGLRGGGETVRSQGRPVSADVLDVLPSRLASAPGSSLPEAGLQLQSLLGQHSALAADMMRGRLRGDPDLAQAANAALGKNTDAIGQLVGALFGDQAKNQFTRLWAGHVTALFNYARGLADNDDAVRAQALTAVTTVEHDLAAFFSGASQGRLPLAAAEAAVKQHIDHLLHQADAYAAGDYALSDRIYRQSYSHAFGLGSALTSTLLPRDAVATLATSSWRLRSELGRLLGEHAVLVIAAMRSGVTNSPDFAAAGEAVNGNTKDMAAAIDTLFGPDAAKRFQSLWADHVDALVAYAAAVAKNDAGQRSAVTAKLNAFEGKFSAFLGGATHNRLAAATLAKAFAMHDQMLRKQAEAFIAKDYPKAHDLSYSTYQEMITLARQLSVAFGGTVAARMPLGGVQTGRGGMAAAVERRSHGR